MVRGAVDLFCGAGGASIGMDSAGFEVLAAADIDEVACETYEENLGLRPLEADLRDTSYAEILEHFELDAESVQLVAGCPPCQNFSSLRDTKPWPEGAPKDELLLAFLQLIDEAEPPLVMFENVPGILTTDGGKYMDYFLDRMDEMGYGVAHGVVNAADYGVPQARKRVVAFGVRDADSDALALPAPTHAHPDETTELDLPPWPDVRGAIEDLPALSAGEQADEPPNHRARNHRGGTLRIIRAIPTNGGSRTDLPENLWLDCHKRLDRKAAGSVYGRMSWEDPAPTMTTRCTTPSCGRFLHPDQDRAITAREAARIQTFPDDFLLPEAQKHAERVIGNAVPPLLVEELLTRFIHENDTGICQA